MFVEKESKEIKFVVMKNEKEVENAEKRSYWSSLKLKRQKEILQLDRYEILKNIKQDLKHVCKCKTCGKRMVRYNKNVEAVFDEYLEKLESRGKKGEKKIKEDNNEELEDILEKLSKKEEKEFNFFKWDFYNNLVYENGKIKLTEGWVNENSNSTFDLLNFIQKKSNQIKNEEENHATEEKVKNNTITK
jgi:hypothetical protein